MDLVIAAATLWCLFGLVIFLPLVGAPLPFRRGAAVLLVLQFAALVYSGRGGAPYVLATHDFPLLGLVLVATAAAHALRAHGSYRSRDAEPRR